MRSVLIILLTISSLMCSGATYFVATAAEGGSNSNPGTISQPFLTWQYAISQMTNAGDTVFVRGGIYYLTGADPWIEINPPNNNGVNGTAVERSFFGAYQPDFDAGDYPILDCGGAWSITSTNYSALGLDFANYWHIKGITVRNMWQGGDAGRRPQGIGGTNSANIIFENCIAHDITARGFYFESGAWNAWDGANAPQASDTTMWINCDAYNICDSANNSSGDAWKCGNYYRGVFIWEGCRAWNYADDGFDPSGAGKRIFRNCWAMSTSKYSGLGGIEGNGFKTAAVGAEQMGHYPLGYVFVEISNCLAAYCMGYGFYNNLELGDDNYAHYYNNTSYKNEGGFFDLPLGESVTWRGIVHRNNLAYDNINETYEQVGIYNPSVYTESNNTWVATQETGAGSWPGWEYNTGFTVTDADFVSLDSSQIRGPRKSDWSLPDITFMRLAEGSDLIDGGVDVGLPYAGDAPDLGYAEYGEAEASNATDIVSFSFAEQTGAATISTVNHSVGIEVAFGTDVTSLSPTISLSYGATILPTSGTARNFSAPVNYTVTAEDGVTEQVWTVTVAVAEEVIVEHPGVIGNQFVIYNGVIVKI